MNAGREVEELTSEDLRSGARREEYTQALLRASEGYKRP